LDALFGEEREAPAFPAEPAQESVELLYVSVEHLSLSPFQPRLTFDSQELQELASSIEQKGVLQPLLVRRLGAEVQLVAGERRLRAAKMAGLTQVPCRVLNLSEAEALEVAVLENIQRADLSPLEEAKGYRQLMERCGYTQEALSQRLGKSRAHIANMIRLLGLPEDVQEKLERKQLTTGHARALIGTSDPSQWATLIVDRNLSVRQVEKLMRQHRSPDARSPGSRYAASSPPQPGGSSPASSSEEETLAQELQEITGLPVTLQVTEGGGTLTVHFPSPTELDHFLGRLTRAYLADRPPPPPPHLDLSLQSYDEDEG
jgi:ParB family chromosome partitioning protein